MQFDGIVPVIQCRVIDETLAFYQQALRYIIINKTVTDKGLQWVYIKSDNTYLMLQKNENIADQRQDYMSNIVLHYYTTDVQAQHQFIRAKGFDVGSIEDTSYNIRQFYISDPEGNRMAIGQMIENKS